MTTFVPARQLRTLPALTLRRAPGRWRACRGAAVVLRLAPERSAPGAEVLSSG